jgi:mannitol/fructose-specific phosphotransferase system IIA component
MNLEIIPIGISVGTTASVADEVVEWMSDPEAGWTLISVEETPRSLGLDDTVLLDVVLGLNCILNEHSMALDLIGNVLLESQVMSTMDSESSVETLMNRNTSGIGFVDGTNHVEMDSVSS